MSGAIGNALAPAETYSRAGRTFQDYQRRLSEEGAADYDQLANQDWENLQRYGSAVGLPVQTGPSSTSVTKENPNWFEKAWDAFFAEGGMIPRFQAGGDTAIIPQGPQANFKWEKQDGRFQLVPQERRRGTVMPTYSNPVGGFSTVDTRTGDYTGGPRAGGSGGNGAGQAVVPDAHHTQTHLSLIHI